MADAEVRGAGVAFADVDVGVIAEPAHPVPKATASDAVRARTVDCAHRLQGDDAAWPMRRREGNPGHLAGAHRHGEVELHGE